MDEISDEDYRQMSSGQRLAHVDAISRQVRQAHARYFLERNPWAMPADILLDWMRIVGIDKIVPPEELAYHTTDTPIIVNARSELKTVKGINIDGTDYSTR